MLAKNRAEFIDLFSELPEPRSDEQLSYPLTEILFLVIAAVLSGAEGWRKIVRYGESKLPLLREFFAYESGIPSRYTLMRVFSLLDKRWLESWLLGWSSGCLESLEGELIAIDGKALRGASKGGQRDGAVYLLNAFATTQGLVLGHQAIAAKHNEITAIPVLLRQLHLDGAIVSMDAIGCQKAIAHQIVAQGADFFLALKENQPHLLDDVRTYFDNPPSGLAYTETLDKGHGRLERRRCWSCTDLSWLHERHPQWPLFQGICKVESERHVNTQCMTEQRYYITSQAASPAHYLAYARRHWAIENNLHWVLDVQLREDDAHIRAAHAAENMGSVRKAVYNLVKLYKKQTRDQAALSTLRMTAAWDDRVAQNILSRLVA